MSSDDMTSESSSFQEVAALWELSEQEQEELVDLRQRLLDVQSPLNQWRDLVRFLRARPGNVTAAETMFRQMVQWRTVHDVDATLKTYTPPSEMLRYYPGALLEGFDREGDPVFVSRLGVADGVGLLHRYGKDEMIRHAIWIRELVVQKVKEVEEKRGRPVRRICLIEDLHGLSLKTHGHRGLLSAYGEIMRLDQDNYPETAKKLLIVRAPTLFRMIWSMAKHFFDPGVVRKMFFCGVSDYQTVLDQYVELEVLPEEIVPGIGRGKAVEGMPSDFLGGRLP
jgi:hypothetical protein